jgi:hypothetical protein
VNLQERLHPNAPRAKGTSREIALGRGALACQRVGFAAMRQNTLEF